MIWWCCQASAIELTISIDYSAQRDGVNTFHSLSQRWISTLGGPRDRYALMIQFKYCSALIETGDTLKSWLSRPISIDRSCRFFVGSLSDRQPLDRCCSQSVGPPETEQIRTRIVCVCLSPLIVIWLASSSTIQLAVCLFAIGGRSSTGTHTAVQWAPIHPAGVSASARCSWIQSKAHSAVGVSRA